LYLNYESLLEAMPHQRQFLASLLTVKPNTT
jgi:hypothetical protein